MKKANASYFNQIFKALPVNDSTISDWHTRNEETMLIIIRDALITEDIRLKDDFNYSYNVQFVDCQFQGSIYIDAGNFKNIGFLNVKQAVNSTIKIAGGNFNELCFDQNSQLLGNIIISGGTFQSIGIGAATFSRRAIIGSCSCKVLTCLTANFEKDLLFTANKIETILLKDTNCQKVYINTGDYGLIHIDGSSNIKKLELICGNFGFLSLNNDGIVEVSANKPKTNTALVFSQVTFGQMGKLNSLFGNCEIQKLIFQPSFLHKDSVLRFQNIKVNTLEFEDFVNFGQVSFSNIKLEENLSVKNSDLGKTAFINSGIAHAKVNFEDSKITDAFFSKGTFPNKIAENEHQQRLAYAQLKKINEAKGDYLEANIFYAKEMNAYYNTITWRKNFWEKVNLSFNKFSNNHGQSWKIGMICLITTSVAFFWLYLLLLNIELGSLCSEKDWGFFFKCISYYFEFLNPVHRTDEIAKGLVNDIPPIARIIEGVSRIFIAFGIYQLVQAFRKHGKK